MNENIFFHTALVDKKIPYLPDASRSQKKMTHLPNKKLQEKIRMLRYNHFKITFISS